MGIHRVDGQTKVTGTEAEDKPIKVNRNLHGKAMRRKVIQEQL